VGNTSNEVAKVAEKWTFPWPIMDVLIGGKSSIDLPNLNISGWSDASAFVRSYGFDLSNPKDQRYINAMFVEAIGFIENHLLPKNWRKRRKVPDEITECQDVRHLLIWASALGQEDTLKRVWSCAILRIMHTICHIEAVYSSVDLEVGRQQIMELFSSHILRDENGTLWLGRGDDRVELSSVEWKQRKSRESIILKLLHKPGNVAETIYDLVGIRIVTKKLSDVMAAVKYLGQCYLITFPNCHPMRARNNLVDIDLFRGHLDSLLQLLLKGTISPADFTAMIDKLTAPMAGTEKSNPHSNESYRAVQLTCRQMIRGSSYAFSWLNKLAAYAQECGPKNTPAWVPQILDLAGSWNGVSAMAEKAVFFPFEVQVMDEQAYGTISSGPASHRRYKEAQVRTARRRVLADVLRLS
jgi:uncharacterized protein (TIGR04562 family)